MKKTLVAVVIASSLIATGAAEAKPKWLKKVLKVAPIVAVVVTAATGGTLLPVSAP